ncbi:MAG: protein kinase, partial [Gemmatimonadaceae bacterium]
MTDAHERLREALRDRYLIERELGAGGMATVFLARDIKHDRDVAIKLLKPELAASIGADRFLREIRTTAQLQHPHIMPLFDSGSADGLLYYVMPLIQGESLADYLERTGPLPIDEAIRIVRQIAGALDFAHRKGLVHRDIKPENILLHDGEALLADFGIAVGTRETGNDRLTGTGFSLGSPRYMSPEQAVGERDIDARADIYSLGAVTYEIVSGVPPVTGTSAQSMLAKLLTEKPKLLKEVRTDAPDALDAAVMRALEKQPADRFATAREFADALTTMSPTSATRTASSKANAANEAPASRLTAPRSRATIVGALVAIVAIVAVGAYFGLRKPTVALESIAVLPLENRTKDSTQDYFVEGITDELTGQLATIKQLRVTSRGSAMSFTGKNKPAAPEIAKALNVDAIVQGAVSRHGDTVHVSVELIDARQDRQLWQGSYDRKSSDVLLLQAELAKLIAEKINVQLTSSEETRLSAVQTVNPQSHEAYLKGRYFFNRPSDENLQKAIAQFEEAVRLSPTFAPAYSGLSDAYLWAGYNEGLMTASEAKPKARAAAEMAVKLDSMSA